MLGNARTYSGFAVDDLDTAREFYGETLGLEVSTNPAGLFVNVADGRETLIYHKPDFVPATYTILNFEVPDVDATVAGLNSRGIEMERYDGFDQDEQGIARISGFPAGRVVHRPGGKHPLRA